MRTSHAGWIGRNLRTSWRWWLYFAFRWELRDYDRCSAGRMVFGVRFRCLRPATWGRACAWHQ